MNAIKLKSKRNNSELIMENEVINTSQTNFPKNVMVFKLKNERKNLKDRIKSAYNIILNGELYDEFTFEENEMNYLTNVLKKQEKDKENLIKQYNKKDKYIQDMLNFDIKSFLTKWFGERKIKTISSEVRFNTIEEEKERYIKLGVNPDKILVTDLPVFTYSLTKNKIVNYHDSFDLISDGNGSFKMTNENNITLGVETYTEDYVKENLEKINSLGIVIYPTLKIYDNEENNKFYRFTFIPEKTN